MESSFHPIQGGYDIPMRVVGANIPYEWLIYILMLIPLGIFIYGAYRRIRIWRLGQGEHGESGDPDMVVDQQYPGPKTGDPQAWGRLDALLAILGLCFSAFSYCCLGYVE